MPKPTVNNPFELHIWELTANEWFRISGEHVLIYDQHVLDAYRAGLFGTDDERVCQDALWLVRLHHELRKSAA